MNPNLAGLLDDGEVLALEDGTEIEAAGPLALFGSYRRRGRRGLSEIKHYGPTGSATFYIGRAVGGASTARRDGCREFAEGLPDPNAPTALPVEAITQTFFDLRAQQISAGKVGGNVIATTGWYQGEPEESVVITVFDEGLDGSEFSARMESIAEDLAWDLCQDAVILIQLGEHQTETYCASHVGEC